MNSAHACGAKGRATPRRAPVQSLLVPQASTSPCRAQRRSLALVLGKPWETASSPDSLMHNSSDPAFTDAGRSETRAGQALGAPRPPPERRLAAKKTPAMTSVAAIPATPKQSILWPSIRGPRDRAYADFNPPRSGAAAVLMTYGRPAEKLSSPP